MLLEKLSEYANRLDMPPSMYAKTYVKWYVTLDTNGHLQGFVRLTGSGKKQDRGKEFIAPNLVRSSGIAPKVLADTGEYVLGIPREKSKAVRVADAHQQFKALTILCAEQTQEASLKAVNAFLDAWKPEAAVLPEGFDPGDVLTFRVDDVVPIELPSVQKFWANYTADLRADGRQIMQCLICGDMKPVEAVQPLKIKGIPHGQTSGMMLISTNANAFESYGLEGFTAPTCRGCGERFGKTANELISQENTHLYIGPIVYIFWTRRPSDFSPVLLLREPNSEDVKALLESAWKGQEHVVADTNDFYATAFSASGGRAVVRDWLETTVEQVKINLTHWFQLQRLVDTWGEEGKPLGLYPLAASLYRDASRDMVANVPRVLLRCALFGNPFPDWLLFQAVRRNRAEQNVTRPRMTLIKMVLLSQLGNLSQKETDVMEKLDRSNRDPAYLCGRLLAELEAIQKAAIPGAKATIIDRYFGTASSAPATVFGQLLRGSQSHLSKLRKEKEGAYYSLQGRLEEIMVGLSSFPSTLSLKEQAIFSLGYYHQRAEDRASATARKQTQGEAKKENE